MGKFVPKYTKKEVEYIASENGCKLLSDYNTMDQKIEFQCRCGNHFITTFDKFLNRNKRQCNICGRKRTVNIQKLSIDKVSMKIKQYGGELVSNEYNNYKSTILIKCKCGKIFSTSLAKYINSHHSCPDCVHKRMVSINQKYTKEYIYDLCEKNKSQLISFSGENFINTKSLVVIKCISCGKPFATSLRYILAVKKFECNDCVFAKAPNSKGEEIIKNILLKNNLEFKQEISFTDCVYKGKLRFDFGVFIKGKLYLIEFDGIQHFFSFEYYGGEKTFLNLQIRDRIKNEYCNIHNIPLLRIRYDEINFCEQKINKFLSTR